jgi:cytochrome c551/c552
MEGRDISHDDSGPSFEDIAAARRQVQRSQESLLKKQLPGRAFQHLLG